MTSPSPSPTAAELHEQLSWWWEQVLRPGLGGLTDTDLTDARVGERLVSVASLLAQRASFHFGDRSLTDDRLPALPASAVDALLLLDEAWADWDSGVLSADDVRLRRAHQGPPGTMDERYPLWALVLHVNREVVQAGAQLLLLLER
ncbi:MAG: hypothetical protein Q8R60_11810 [Mycobacteriales bacterium]|nr:hypothetical protein [Mycobacteriales bacterium]